jgi:hypothetical protein
MAGEVLLRANKQLQTPFTLSEALILSYQNSLVLMRRNPPELAVEDEPDIVRQFCEYGDEEYQRYGGGEGVLTARGGGGFRNHQEGECVPTIKKARVEREDFVKLVVSVIKDFQGGLVQEAYIQLQKGTEETTMWIPLDPVDFSLSGDAHMSSLRTGPTRLLNVCYYVRTWLEHHDRADALHCAGPLNLLISTEVNYKRDKHSRSELQNRKSIWQGSAYRLRFRFKGQCYEEDEWSYLEQLKDWTRVDPEAFWKGTLSESRLDTILGMQQDALDRFMSDTS